MRPLTLRAGMTYCLRQDGLPLRVAGLRTDDIV